MTNTVGATTAFSISKAAAMRSASGYPRKKSLRFGAPFLPRSPLEYARMLSEKMRKHDVKCFLVNTGWVGGGFGVGARMNLEYTRAMVNSAIAGDLDQVATSPHPIFHVAVPTSCPGVPPEILDARGQWKDRAAYDRQAQNLDGLFRKNFEKFGEAAQEILGAVHAAR